MMNEHRSGKREASIDVDDHPTAPVISVPWLVAAVAHRRRMILAVAAFGFLLSLVVALLRVTYFTATFSFVPQAGQDQSRASGLASLAGQFGINLGAVAGQGPSPQLYADLLHTREILAVVVNDTVVNTAGDHVLLPDFLGVKGESGPVRTENTVRFLRDRVVGVSVAARTSGVITVTARTRSPQASLTIAKQLLDALNSFNVAKRKSQATEERRFTEGRLADAKATLRKSEDALQQFLQGNRQYTGSPELVFQRERLERDVNLQQQVVTGLAQQYEDARIREVRDTPVFTVLEEPVLPALPDPRGRATTVVLGTILAALVGVAWAVGRTGLERQYALETERGARSGPPSEPQGPPSFIRTV
ncbi:MAG TPA: hypothetical protein VGM50_18710 [Gemmatimonadaceae bacterium]|jgi:uncharacterized protein involved in exopolysaccharide biosynthesis